MIIYVMRHGETKSNVERRVQGWSNDPLNEKGVLLAEITGKEMKGIKFDVAFSSSLDRAKKTARLVLDNSGNTDTEIIVDDRIIEISFGDWEKKRFEEIDIDGQDLKQFLENAYYFKGAPNGESLISVSERTQNFLKELVANPDMQDKTILVATHGCAMRAMLNFLYEDKTNFWQERIPYNCAVNILEAKDGNIRFLEKDKIYYDKSLAREYKGQIGENK